MLEASNLVAIAVCLDRECIHDGTDDCWNCWNPSMLTACY